MHKIIIIIFVTLCHLSSQNIFTLNYHREDWRIIKESVNLYNTSDKLFIEINTYSPYTLINHSKEAIKSNNYRIKYIFFLFINRTSNDL